MSIVITSESASDPNLNHIVFGSPTLPWVTTTNPQIKLMNQVLAQFAPGTSPIGSPTLGWTSAQLFAGNSIYWPNKNQITSADVLDGMDKLRNDDVGGMTAPLSFHAGQDAKSTVCGYEMEIVNGKYISPNNGGRECL